MGYISALLLLTATVNVCWGIPIDNALRGGRAPEVDCKEDSIQVVFITRKPFQGRIYVVGHSGKEPCYSENRNSTTTAISIPKALEECGVVTLRSENPPGVYVNVKVMVSFHPLFVTKVDKGFEISCFYMEVEKSITFPLSVSMKDLGGFTTVAEMPRCRYEVFKDSLPATVVGVGDPLKHKWSCESSAPGLWCMVVHSCNVDDGQGVTAEIVDDKGCAKDKFLLDQLEYSDENNLMVMKEAHAFKFADRVAVNFACSVRLTVKDGDQCPRPQCPVLRRRRSPEEDLFAQPATAEIDVRSQQLDVLDPQGDFGMGTDNPAFHDAVRQASDYIRFGSEVAVRRARWLERLRVDCVPRAVTATLSTAFVAVVASLLVAVISLWRTNRRLARNK